MLSSVNNVSFENPSVDILEAYYYGINGVFGTRFPGVNPVRFDYTAAEIGEGTKRGTEVMVVEYGDTVEIVFQGTSLVAAVDHPMHLHGYSFYVVGWGIGNFDDGRDRGKFNLVDPPLMNTIAVPINGWVAVRFTANNPGTFSCTILLKILKF